MKLKPYKVKSKVTIKGDRTGGFILEVQDSMGFKGDIALTMVELEKIYQILKKKFDQRKKERK